MIDRSRIREHMKVLGSDGLPVGTVDCVKGDKLILTKSDPASGGKHHTLPLEWVTRIENDELRLNETAETARTNWTDAEPPGETGRAACS